MTDLVIVRGKHSGYDPVYTSIAHDTRPGHYATIEIANGAVKERRLYRASERKLLEARLDERTFGRILVDPREDPALLPKVTVPHAMDADLNALRRAKSDAEQTDLLKLSDVVRTRLDQSDGTFRGFRGAAKSDALKTDKVAFQVNKQKEFTEYRGGMQMTNGLVQELTRVDAHTPEWTELLSRVNIGLNAVDRAANVERL